MTEQSIESLPLRIELLVSCMNQGAVKTLQFCKAKTDVLIVNQTTFEHVSTFKFKDEKNNEHNCRYICTEESGLSNSRNKAIAESTGDILLFVDDDEEMVTGYAEIISEAFKMHPDADIITFALNYSEKKFPNKEKRIGYLGALKSCSPQIAVKRTSIVNQNIRFDPTMGSGTGNGGGEENKFLFDCLKKKLKIYYVPNIIATIHKGESKWFSSFNKKFFFNRGYSTSKILGRTLAWLYAFEFCIAKWPLYKHEMSFWCALYYHIKGTFSLNRQRVD